jgi:signal transduction histidine kinase
LSDIIEVKDLQEIQDSFTEATGVASVITDQNGTPITVPSNLSNVCTLIRQTVKGKENCTLSEKKIGQHAAQIGKPAIEQCFGCGFVNAGAPIYIGNRLIATWIIRQCNIGKFDKSRIELYADEIGADKEQILKEYEKMGSMPIEQFQKVTNLLWILAKELSSFAYNNILLAKKIEEQKEFEANLIHAKEKAEESGRLKTAFLQNISHEIRTPMNAIMGFSGILNKQDLNEEKQKGFINIIQNNCHQLLSIVSNILTISSVETKQEKVDIQKVSVNEIILDLLSIYKTQAFNQNISLFSKKTLANKEAEIYTDKKKLTQILSNLLSNALKFTHQGYVEFGYNVVVEPRHQPVVGLNALALQTTPMMCFYVKDTGIGIKPEFQESIFERFSQAEMALNKKYGGTGLGLAISKAFVELLGGKIWVESEPSKGSTFNFLIPYNQVNYSEKLLTELTLRNEHRTILIAEDEVYNYLFFEELLVGHGLKIIHAKNGQEAVDLCKLNEDIGLILMDIRMPVMDGATATKIIKSFRPDLPIVAQTAYALEKEIKQITEYGFDGYLTKPIDPDIMFQMVSKYIVID